MTGRYLHVRVAISREEQDALTVAFGKPPVGLRRLLDVWLAEHCKHCGEQIVGHTHNSGPQAGLGRCAVEPYGYNAEAINEPCTIPCWGSHPEPPPITTIHRSKP
jgi:hypothetical protein